MTGTEAVKFPMPKSFSTSGTRKVPDPKDKGSKLTIFSNRSEILISLSAVSMHMAERIRRDIVKQISEILNLENPNYDGCLIKKTSFLGFLKFITLKKIKPSAYSVSSRGNFMASWFHAEDRIHLEFDENSISTVVSKKTGDYFEYFAHNGSLPDSKNFIDKNDFSAWINET